MPFSAAVMRVTVPASAGAQSNPGAPAAPSAAEPAQTPGRSYVDLTDGAVDGGVMSRWTAALSWHATREWRVDINSGYITLDKAPSAATPTASLAGSYGTCSRDSIDRYAVMFIRYTHGCPLFGADVTLPGQPTPPGSGGGSGGITIPSATTSGNFDSAALAGFRVERARVSIEGEFLWAGMSDSVETPHFTLTVETISFRIMGGVDVAPALYIDAGVRRFALNMTASILDFQPVTWKPGIWEPVVGVTFRPQLASKLRIFTRADVGWGGDESSRSGAATASIEWKPSTCRSAQAGAGGISGSTAQC